jgi:hypothetical protein
MFKPGDRVVCICEYDTGRNEDGNKYDIEKSQIYTISKINKLSDGNIDYQVYDSFYYWSPKCFISVQEYRKLKLKKLCLNQKIK